MGDGDFLGFFMSWKVGWFGYFFVTLHDVFGG